MSDSFMADPIRPGDMNSSSTMQNNNPNRSSNSNVGGILLIVFLIMFAGPLIFGLIVFLAVLNGEKILEEVSSGDSESRKYAHYYELDDKQQMAAATIFSTGTLYLKGGPKQIAQSDCRLLKNAVVGFFNQEVSPAEWYDDTFCEEGVINLDTYFTDGSDDKNGGKVARIDIGPENSGQLCMNIEFADNFRYIMNAKKLGHCDAAKIRIGADNIEVPEVKPEYGINSNQENDEDVDTMPEKAGTVQRS